MQTWKHTGCWRSWRRADREAGAGGKAGRRMAGQANMQVGGQAGAQAGRRAGGQVGSRRAGRQQAAGGQAGTLVGW